ncbi:MAG: hypothetical protein KGD63_08145 [Candidatus Lokiarchaeota archaeon]|nr:hypothetical protein [Candidatus Lokiarchaeota archaeon]
MTLKFNSCPHCGQQIVFKVNFNDIDNSRFPAPIYIHHNNEQCGKISTFFLDSRLQVSYKDRDKKPGALKTIETSQ